MSSALDRFRRSGNCRAGRRRSRLRRGCRPVVERLEDYVLQASVAGGSALAADTGITAERADQVGLDEPGLAATTTTLSSSENPATLGATVTYTAVVGTVQGAGTPTGFVEFYGGPSPVIDPINVPVSVVAGQVEATLGVDALDVGTQTIYAQFGGDTNVAGSPATPCTETSDPAGTPPTNTTLAADTSPSTAGQPVTFTATVAPSSTTGTPTGTVTFLVDGMPQTPVPLAVVGGQDIATFSDAALGGGTHTVVASYSGDSSFASSHAAPLTETVDLNPTTTTLSASANPVTVGQSVTFTADVGTANGAGTPTGSVQFYGNNGVGVVWDPVDVPLMVVGGQVEAVFTVPAFEVGTLTIHASYNGDTNFAGSAATPLTVAVNSISTPTPTPTSTPPQSPSIAGVQHSENGLTSISLGFSEALNPGSADNAHLYRLLGAVRQQGKQVFRTPVRIKSVRYTATTQSVTITLARPHKGHFTSDQSRPDGRQRCVEQPSVHDHRGIDRHRADELENHDEIGFSVANQMIRR